MSSESLHNGDLLGSDPPLVCEFEPTVAPHVSSWLPAATCMLDTIQRMRQAAIFLQSAASENEDSRKCLPFGWPSLRSIRSDLNALKFPMFDDFVRALIKMLCPPIETAWIASEAIVSKCEQICKLDIVAPFITAAKLRSEFNDALIQVRQQLSKVSENTQPASSLSVHTNDGPTATTGSKSLVQLKLPFQITKKSSSFTASDSPALPAVVTTPSIDAPSSTPLSVSVEVSSPAILSQASSDICLTPLLSVPADIELSFPDKSSDAILEASPMPSQVFSRPEKRASLLYDHDVNSAPLTSSIDFFFKDVHGEIPGASGVQCSGSAFTTTGSVRKNNQDRFCLNEIASTGFLFGVFDGHGLMGDLAARVCASQIPNRFQSHLTSSKSVQQSLELSINEANELLLSISAHEQVLLSNLLSMHQLPDMVCDYGTTCVLGFVSSTSIHVLNVGDSRCVLFERLHSCSVDNCSCLAAHSNGTSKKRAASHQKQFSWSWTPLTTDHNPTLRIDERQRVEREGGHCFWNFDEVRCCPAGMTSEQARAKTLTLNMSRALGHIVLSQHGISSTPEANSIGITSTEAAATASTEQEDNQTKRWKGESSQNLSQSTSRHTTVMDRFIVAGSDGLWNVVDMDDIIGVLNESSNSHEIGEALLRLADKKWIDLNPRSARTTKKGKHEMSIGDNVSVSVLRLVRPM